MVEDLRQLPSSRTTKMAIIAASIATGSLALMVRGTAVRLKDRLLKIQHLSGKTCQKRQVQRAVDNAISKRTVMKTGPVPSYPNIRNTGDIKIMQSVRAFVRQKVHIDAKIAAPDMSSCVDCVVMDISEGGALVSAGRNAAAIPDRVYLWQSKTGTVFECEVRWRKLNLVGLRFVDSAGRAKVQAVIDRCRPNVPARSVS